MICLMNYINECFASMCNLNNPFEKLPKSHASQ